MSRFPCLERIPSADRTAMDTAATTLVTKMTPFAPEIPANLRRSMASLSLTDQSKEFVERGLEIVKDNPEMKAPTLDVPLWEKSIEEYEDLRPIYTKVEQAEQMMSDYMRIAGTTARAEFNELYRCIEILHRNGYSKAVPLYEELSRLHRNRFGPRPARPCSDAEIIQEHNSNLGLLKDAHALILEHKEPLKGLLKEQIELEGK